MVSIILASRQWHIHIMILFSWGMNTSCVQKSASIIKHVSCLPIISERMPCLNGP